MKKLLIGVALAISLVSTAAHAGLNGDTVNVKYYFPNSSSVYQDLGTQVVDSSGAVFNFMGYFSLNVSDTQIKAYDFVFSSYWTPSPFNGFVVTNLTNSFSGGYTVDPSTTMSGLTNPNVTLMSPNSVGVNWNGLSFNEKTVVTLNAVSAVPEPETYALMLAGLGLVGTIARRRKQALAA